MKNTLKQFNNFFLKYFNFTQQIFKVKMYG